MHCRGHKQSQQRHTLHVFDRLPSGTVWWYFTGCVLRPFKNIEVVILLYSRAWALLSHTWLLWQLGTGGCGPERSITAKTSRGHFFEECSDGHWGSLRQNEGVMIDQRQGSKTHILSLSLLDDLWLLAALLSICQLQRDSPTYPHSALYALWQVWLNMSFFTGSRGFVLQIQFDNVVTPRMTNSLKAFWMSWDLFNNNKRGLLVPKCLGWADQTIQRGQLKTSGASIVALIKCAFNTGGERRRTRL